MSLTLPEELTYGKVVGKFLLAVGDGGDGDNLPDPMVPTGLKATFTPTVPLIRTTNPKAIVISKPVVCSIDTEGNLIDPQGNAGVWLVAGTYKVTYSGGDIQLAGPEILVTAANTALAPINLRDFHAPVVVATPSQFVDLASRNAALEGRIVTLETAPEPGGAVDSVNGEIGVVVLTAADVGAQPAGDYATNAALTSGLGGKAATSHTHTSAGITDWTEAVQDALATFFNVTGATVSYNDAGNQIVITVPPDTNTTDPEVTRDAIGAALVGVGNITVAVNDAADTITISTTATANATDAALRDRSTHTGTQAQSTVTNLVTDLAGKSATGHTHPASAVTGLSPVATSGAMSDVGGTLNLGQLAPGGVFTVVWNGTNWRYNGANVTTRPSARTDLTMMALGGTTAPAFGLLDVDFWMKDLT